MALIADDRPDLLKLVNLPSKSGNINIAEQIGTNYFLFGVLLLNDKTGVEINAIATKHREDAEQINLQILRLWIGGKGKPLSWDTLINVLKAIGLNNLTGDIQESIQHKFECLKLLMEFKLLLLHKYMAGKFSFKFIYC